MTSTVNRIVEITAATGMIANFEENAREATKSPELTIKIVGMKGGKPGMRNYMVEVNPAGLDWLIDDFAMRTHEGWEQPISYQWSLQRSVAKLRAIKELWAKEAA